MSETEQLAYARYQDDLRYQASLVESNYGLGLKEGREAGLTEGREAGLTEGIKKGMEQGIEHGKLEVAKRLLAKGMSIEEAAEIAGITVEMLKRAT